MALPQTNQVVDQLPRQYRAAFAPLVKPALGIAVGVVTAAILAAFAMFWMFRDPDQALGVWLLGQNFLVGYAPTPMGVVAGGLWGLAIGFTAGWSIAAIRNLFITLWIVAVGARQQLRASSDFLDEI